MSVETLPWSHGCRNVSEFPPWLCGDLNMGAVYRVHWLRSKAQHDRWSEERTLIDHEMDWTVRFFKYHENQWSARQDVAHSLDQPGHAAYAAKQSEIWKRLREQATYEFQRLHLL